MFELISRKKVTTLWSLMFCFYIFVLILLLTLTNGLNANSNSNSISIKRSNIKKLHSKNLNENYEKSINDENSYISAYANTRSVNLNQANDACHLNIECNSKYFVAAFSFLSKSC